MSSIVYTVFLFITVAVKSRFTDIYASKIYTLDVPLVVRNGTGPIDLSCIYNVSKDENGLVIKWYHNEDQIYQWIPPMPPQDVGVINGLAEYPEQNLKLSNSRSIIRLKMAIIEMTGEYTLPETSLSIHASSFNESHLNLICIANGGQPQPILKIYIEGIEVNNYHDKIVKTMGYTNIVSGTRSAIVKNPLEPLLLECEISIPQTDYKRREKIVYYPIQMLPQISSASNYKIGDITFIIYIVLLLK
ncbi:hypothetical protein WN51_13214 [Melipona quadrifasciata]|uniref:Ig-like domain-containing protein n=1 Tax=Melipona quadrifasciata TaxID=166423 RepID=A0A0N0U5J4_9HYME|nr:hypothetical protein WN51_13214 [Melipona quadrifasciata]